ncbi:MAG TPA: enolase C-terminal domain-like protein [Edaphocola sp.]|nr:enolase C-terminal domain-like protein [Edaphocola sp.]
MDNNFQSMVPIENVMPSAYRVPTASPESDGTLEWDSTTLILVEIDAGGKTGIGYTYGDAGIACFIRDKLERLVMKQDALDIPFLWKKMMDAIRNEGACGMAVMAVSAVDNALWDLKAKILNLSLAKLLGNAREAVPVYGSGAFTSYSINRLCMQMEDWMKEGFTSVKMKIGRHRDEDLFRVKAARERLGEHAELFVDANGAYDVKTALKLAAQFVDCGVTWFEEPVPSSDLEGLAFVRSHCPAVMNIVAGEYGYTLSYFREMLRHGAVNVLQADATRCGGITGFMKAGVLAEAMQIPFSFHCAPAAHVHAAAALNAFYIGEYFYDHARIEQMLFDGMPDPVSGKLAVTLNRPGAGLEFKHRDAAPYKL